MTSAPAFAKINLALAVGPLREDGKHEVITILERIALHDHVQLEPARELLVEGFDGDTIVRDALEALARAAGVEPRWRVRIEKRIPVAAGLGGGSADAAAALGLANALLARPFGRDRLHAVAAEVGADVPFFLREGAQLGTGDGTELTPVALPSDYHVVLVLPDEATKSSTADVYESFDVRGGAAGFESRVASVRAGLTAVETVHALAALPPNDLASSPVAQRLTELGAVRADVSGAGPTVYGLFERADDAHRAGEALADVGRTIVTRPVAR